MAIKGLAEGGDTVLVFNSLSDKNLINLLPGEHEIQLQMPYLGLKLGAYIMDIYAKRKNFITLIALNPLNLQ